MVLDFDPHALLRMRRRQIPEVAVYDVIGDYDRRIDRRDGVTEYYGAWQERALMIVVAWEDEDEMRGYVITAVDRNTREQGR